MRKLNKIKKWSAGILLFWISGISCTKLNVDTYSVIPASSYFQNAAQVAAAKAPVYAAVVNAYDFNSTWLASEVSSDECIFPTRGSDWYDGGTWASLYFHTGQTATNADYYGWWNGAWGENLNGASQCNYIIYTENHLPNPPSTLAADVAEMTCLRSLFYYNAMDIFGNIPYVTDFKVDPSTVQTVPRAQVFDSLERDLLAAIPNLKTNVDATTYGKATVWLAYSILARMYLNAGVYKNTGTYNYSTSNAYWQKCKDACDYIITNGPFTLDPEYFNSFHGPNNLSTPENIFVAPTSATSIIAGNGIIQRSIQFNSALTFGIPCCNYGNNGASATRDFYQFYDTTSTYTWGVKQIAGRSVNSYLRTFNDHRTAQWLTGQQFKGDGVTNWPPWNQWVVDNGDVCCDYSQSGEADALKQSSKIGDFYNNINSPVVYHDDMTIFNDPVGTPVARHAGVRNVKYWPTGQPDGNGSMGNAVVIFRLGDIYLMRGEAEYNLGSTAAALLDFNAVRERAYGEGVGGPHDWTSITEDAILAERGREMAWELVRRTDQVRFGKYTEAHNFPPKPADPDDHFNIAPIPASQINANPNLQQNPGY
jgi:starch-binding outer membrane protein, SusD/RagB family